MAFTHCLIYNQFYRNHFGEGGRGTILTFQSRVGND